MTEQIVLTILSSAGVGATLSGIVLWLGKNWISERLKNAIKSEYDQKLETHKAELKAQSDVELEKLRTDLRISSSEHEIKFSKLHEKRAEVIAETYATLVQAYADLESFLSPMEWSGEPSKQEKYATAMNSVADFYRYFEKHRIYLPASLCSQIDDFVQSMRKKAIGFGVYVRHDENLMPPSEAQKKFEVWGEAHEYFREKVPEARHALEEQLRGILGDTNSKSS